MYMEDLFDAIEKNDLIKVKRLIKGGADINKTDKFGYSGLHLASYKRLYPTDGAHS